MGAKNTGADILPEEKMLNGTAYSQDEYSADDVLVKFICTELIIEYELSEEFHPQLCRWVVDVLNSADSRQDIIRIMLATKIQKAYELLSGKFH